MNESDFLEYVCNNICNYTKSCDGCPIEERVKGGARIIGDGNCEPITQDEAYSLAQLVDLTLIEHIRSDTDLDSIQWLRNIVHAYEKLCKVSGYVGVTEDRADEGRFD